MKKAFLVIALTLISIVSFSQSYTLERIVLSETVNSQVHQKEDFEYLDDSGGRVNIVDNDITVIIGQTHIATYTATEEYEKVKTEDGSEALVCKMVDDKKRNCTLVMSGYQTTITAIFVYGTSKNNSMIKYEFHK